MSKRRRVGRGGFLRPADAEESLDSTLTTQDSTVTTLGGTFSSWRTNSRVNCHSQGLTFSRTASSDNSAAFSSAAASSSLAACSVCTGSATASADKALSVFCSLPTEIIEVIFGLLSIEDRLSFYQVLSRGRYLSTKAKKALSSSGLWRRVKLVARRPDHLVTRPPNPGELLSAPRRPVSARLKVQLLRFFPPLPPPPPSSPSAADFRGDAEDVVDKCQPLDLTVFVLRKHSFELPFDFFLASLINRRYCSAIRSLTFAVEEIWHPDFYPLQRSDVALDRFSQLIDELGPACREINIVKWPRLQDDTVIDETYSEMQAHYASSDASTTDPILAVITNMHIFAHLEVFGLFWFDFEDPEFWAMARSDWCITSHQWAWSEEEFCSGHTLYPTQASREFNVVDNLSNLKELRLTFSSYSDDRYFLDPVFSPISTLRRLKVMIRSSWNGWDGLNAGHRPVGAYWNSLMGRVPDLRVTLTFIEFFDVTKLRDWRLLFYPKIPVSCCQWLPGAVVTLSTLGLIGQAYPDTLTSLDLHTELIDDRGRNDLLSLLSDLIKILRSCHHLTRFIFDSSFTFHFCKVVARLRKAEWRQLVLFRDRLQEARDRPLGEEAEAAVPEGNPIAAFEAGVGKILERKWRFHDARDREYGPRGYHG